MLTAESFCFFFLLKKKKNLFSETAECEGKCKSSDICYYYATSKYNWRHWRLAYIYLLIYTDLFKVTRSPAGTDRYQMPLIATFSWRTFIVCWLRTTCFKWCWSLSEVLDTSLSTVLKGKMNLHASPSADVCSDRLWYKGSQCPSFWVEGTFPL